MNLGTQFRRAVRQHGDAVAIIDGERSLTYRELGKRSAAIAHALLRRGYRKGERAALLMPNCHQAMEIDAALFQTGIIRVPLNGRVSVGEIVAMIDHCSASLLFVDSSYAHIAEQIRSECGSVREIVCVDGGMEGGVSYAELVSERSVGPLETDIDADDTYALLYTSGTSGVLKAAMITHRNWLCLTRNNLIRLGLDSMERGVVGYVAPITHAAGGPVLANLIRGSVNVLFHSFDADQFICDVERYRITDVLLVPVMINMLLASPEIGRHDISSLQTIVYGAAPMAPERIRQALDIFGPILSQGYGQTESCAGGATLTKRDHLAVNDPATIHRLSSAGRPHFECDMRIVDDDGNDVPLGELGEIVLRSDSVMKGYWNAPELTREVFRDGWLLTRDIGRFDEDGYLYLVDRKSDMIITGGFNVYPTEVENILYQHPAVYEAAVVSVPDAKWGEAIKAVVVLKPGLSASAEELIQHCRSSLAAFKAPKSVDFVAELPKSAVGKIMRRAVREEYWRGMERRVG